MIYTPEKKLSTNCKSRNKQKKLPTKYKITTNKKLSD